MSDAKSPDRAAFERNLSKEFYQTLDGDPTMMEAMFWHRIRVSEAFVEFIKDSPIFARLERKCREMFVESSQALLECNPTDHASIAEAQVQVLASAKLMAIIDEAIKDGAQAKQERAATRDEE